MPLAQWHVAWMFWICSFDLFLPFLAPKNRNQAFFINLYHVMILHAFYILGPPSTSVVRWANYFNLASYQCCDDIFSIAELEHCIIRNSPPSHISKFALPKSKYPFALNQSDFRLNFALNCGSQSNPACILLYNCEKLNEQLDMATKMYLEMSVKISLDDKRCQVLLPRVVNWFSDDFGDILATLKPYFKDEDKDILSKCDGNVKIKFHQYSFRCHQLILFDVE